MNWDQAVLDYKMYLQIERGLSKNSVENYALDIKSFQNFLNSENINQFGETCVEIHETFRSKFKAYRKLAKANFNQKRYKKFRKIEKQYLKQLKKLTSN